MSRNSSAPNLTRVSLRPTRLGAAFLGLILLTLVGCVNYSLSLGYGLTFLLGGVWVISAAQVVRAVRLLSLSLLPPAQAVAGQPLAFTAQVQGVGPQTNVRVEARAQQGGGDISGKAISAGSVVRPGQPASLTLTVAAPQRGPLHLTGVRLIAVDTFGLWHAAAMAPDSPPVLVAPAPEARAPAPPQQVVGGQGESGKRVSGQDEFAGVRAYQGGDSPRLISWKHVARTGALLTREFDAPAGTALKLDWADTAPAGDQEARLSRLAAWVQAAQAAGQAFQVNLPGHTGQRSLGLGSGEAHARAAMAALAQVAPFPEPAEVAPRSSGFLDRPAWLGGPAQPLAAGELLPLPPAALQFSLLALGFALVPGLFVWPVWISAVLAGLLGYSALQADRRRRWPAPPAVALLLLAVLAGLGLRAAYGTLLGQGAGTAILAVLLALKAAETRTIRDAKLLSLLGLFLLVTNFFHSQGPLTALHTLLAVSLLLAAAARWVNPATWGQTALLAPARQAWRLMALAAPLAALLFMFFPRPDGPLWRLPFQGQNQTGLADSINAGEFTNLAQDNSVAFRVDFQGGPVPPPEQRYWRGPVYEQYNGESWEQVRQPFGRPSLETLPGPTYRYFLTLEPNGKSWLLGLDTVTALPRGAFLTAGFQAVTTRPASQRTRYEMYSQQARTGRQESVERLNLNASLPAGQSPRAAALGASWRELPPQERLQKAEEFLRQGGFSYTLEPPTLPAANRIDAFLFGSKRGFCEHYASAFAFLMRAAGLPARVVGGYQGGELNPDGGYLIVRQRDAHAWTEVWLPGQGWLRVDPTALIAPARINTNLSTALTQPNATNALARTPWQKLMLRLDTFQNDWNNWVGGYGGDQQRSLLGTLGLNKLGLGEVGGAPYLLGLLLLSTLALVPALLLARRGVRPRDPALAALYALSEKLRLPRLPGETASAYVERAAAAFPALERELGDLARLFNEGRYGVSGSGQVKELQERVRRVRRPPAG